MARQDPATARWFKSSYSGGDGGCVEVAVDEGAVRVRDSKDVDGPHLVFARNAWTQFVDGVKFGEFDRPPGPADGAR